MTQAVCDHTSVGIIVWKGPDLLLIKRRRPPFGFACPAGHVDDHGSYERAATIELAEEVGLTAIKLALVHEEWIDNACRRVGGNRHYWKVFEAKVKGVIIPSLDETFGAFWAPPAQVNRLTNRTQKYLRGDVSGADWNARPGLEPVWAYIFGRLREKQWSPTIF